MMFSVLAQLLQLSTARILVRDRDSSPLPPVRRSETGFNNSCLARDSSLNREGPREFNCAQFVIESTDRLWNMYRGYGYCIFTFYKGTVAVDFDVVEGYLRQYMTEDWESITVMGEYLRGMDQLIELVNTTLVAFPDIQLHIVDSFCEGNDIDGYKTSMPVLHTATHTGHHPVFGPPTGRRAAWYGVPNSFIKNINGQWKYDELIKHNIISNENLIDTQQRLTCQTPCHCTHKWEPRSLNR